MGYFEENTTFCVLEYGSGLAGMGYFAMPRGDRATIPAVNRRLHNSDPTRRRREERRVERRRQRSRCFFSFKVLCVPLSLSLSFLFEILSLSSSLEHRCTDFFFLSFFFVFFLGVIFLIVFLFRSFRVGGGSASAAALSSSRLFLIVFFALSLCFVFGFSLLLLLLLGCFCFFCSSFHGLGLRFWIASKLVADRGREKRLWRRLWRW